MQIQSEVNTPHALIHVFANKSQFSPALGGVPGNAHDWGVSETVRPSNKRRGGVFQRRSLSFVYDEVV